MGAILSTLEQGGSSAIYSLISLVTFFCLFTGVVIWTMRKSHDDTFEQARHLPFKDENEGKTPGEMIHE